MQAYGMQSTNGLAGFSSWKATGKCSRGTRVGLKFYHAFGFIRGTLLGARQFLYSDVTLSF